MSKPRRASTDTSREVGVMMTGVLATGGRLATVETFISTRGGSTLTPSFRGSITREGPHSALARSRGTRPLLGMKVSFTPKEYARLLELAHLGLWVAGARPDDPATMPERYAAISQKATTWRKQHEHEILQEFSDLLAIPNLASDKPNIERNATAIRALCEKRGLTTQLLTLEGAPPIVVADLTASEAKRTIAVYAHYDGQPVDATKWKSDPWKPVMRDSAGNDVDWKKPKAIDPEWRLYARSAGDDKAPIIGMLAALDALRASELKPSVNLRFVFEGEEEAGSPHLARYLEKYPKELRPDAWILCDGPVHQSRRAELFFGARGTFDLELTVYGPIKGLHDGHYGNWVPNPIVRLTHLLDSMRDEDGRILIKGFYDNVKSPTAAELAAIAKIPGVQADLRREFQIAARLLFRRT